MILTKYITPNGILPKLNANAKPEVLKELTHLLFDTRRIKGVAAALDQILAREANESTGIGKGLAVPHARIPGLKTLACAVGRSNSGIDFMALDGKPVHLVFLICYPPEQQTVYLNFLATVTRLLRSPEYFQSLMTAQTENDIFALLESRSESFTDAHVEQVRKIKTDPGIARVPDAHADLVLLARLQMYQEMLAVPKATGKAQIQKRIDSIRSLVEPRILKHYDRLMQSRGPALVPVEGDTCQGCYMRLPSKLAQQVRQDTDHIHTCNNCSRFIYIV